MNRWLKLLVFLVVGYLTMTRSFAYLGYPPLRIFVGELAFFAFLMAKPRIIFDRWLNAIQRPTPYSAFATALVFSLAYGLFEMFRGIVNGYSPVLVLEGFAFHYYPLWFFVGMWAARQDWSLLPRTVRLIAWVNGIYGVLYVLILSRIPYLMPGSSDVLLFGQPAGSSIVLLGLICIEPRLSRVWHLLVLNLGVMLAMQVRAEYLGFAIGVMLWALLSGNIGRLMAGAVVLAGLLIAGLATDFSIPAPGTRGGKISTRDIFGRVIAPVDTELAQQYSKNAASQAGTFYWRVIWWRAIWENVHQDTQTAVMGEGYGYPIANLVGYRERDIRTPHNVFFYALAYGGWLGVALFAMVQLGLAGVLWTAWRHTRSPFGIVLWVSSVCGAFFGNWLEAPFGAIPFYLLAGMAAAPVLSQVYYYYARPVGAQLLSEARG
jgi:hypothetical protein